MENAEFENRLKELSAMSESLETDVLFNECYESLLADVKGGPEQFQRAERMKRLLLLQAAFMTRQWIKSKRIMGMI